MTARASQIAPETEADYCLGCGSSLEVCPIRGVCKEPSPSGRDAHPGDLDVSKASQIDDWPECEFDGCSNPVSFKKRDRFGEPHQACTAHEESLERWVRIHNGWETLEEGEEEEGEDAT